MFDEMTNTISEDTVSFLYNVENPDKVERKRVAQVINPNKKEENMPVVNKGKKIGRNDPCPCGSGKKYKKCCGKNE